MFAMPFDALGSLRLFAVPIGDGNQNFVQFKARPASAAANPPNRLAAECVSPISRGRYLPYLHTLSLDPSRRQVLASYATTDDRKGERESVCVYVKCVLEPVILGRCVSGPTTTEQQQQQQPARKGESSAAAWAAVEQFRKFSFAGACTTSPSTPTRAPEKQKYICKLYASLDLISLPHDYLSLTPVERCLLLACLLLAAAASHSPTRLLFTLLLRISLPCLLSVLFSFATVVRASLLPILTYLRPICRFFRTIVPLPNDLTLFYGPRDRQTDTDRHRHKTDRRTHPLTLLHSRSLDPSRSPK